jgi:hypothetical protein
MGDAVMPSGLVKLIAGFIAGALAVLIFHQGMYVIMQQAGLPLRGTPWSMAAIPPYGVPRTVNAMFWGGLWGIVYAYLIDYIPGGMGWLKGLIFGMIFPMLIGSWLVVAMIKGTFNVMALRNGFLLNGVAFGIGLGLLYPLVAGMMGSRSEARS